MRASGRIGERHGRLDILVNNAGILPEATEDGGNGPLDVELASIPDDGPSGRFFDGNGPVAW